MYDFLICCVQVAESVSKYCILLHIREGSTDAANYFAICNPQIPHFESKFYVMIHWLAAVLNYCQP